MVRSKYLGNKQVGNVSHRQNDSATWTDLSKIKDLYLQKIIKGGEGTLLWKDSWVSEKPLCTTFPNLFKLCEQLDITVYQAKCSASSITFTRWLPDDLKDYWDRNLRELENLQLSSSGDRI